MNRVIVDCPDAESVAQLAAKQFVRRANDAIRERDVFRVALSGGSTPKRMYELLAEPGLARQLDWGSVHIFFGDERAVGPDDDQSNFKTAHVGLLSHVGVPTGQIHRMAGERGDLNLAARDYAAEIARVFGGSTTLPRFDLIFLGMGKDGHTASLFPHTAALNETKAWVSANDVPSMQTQRLTLSAPVINAARSVVFTVAGADKAEALRAVLQGGRDPQQYPSQLIAPQDGELIWLVDQAASAQLTLKLQNPANLA
ncbi:MAG: 6-phosphogluconolactonase [Vicinamibacteria bacterium]